MPFVLRLFFSALGLSLVGAGLWVRAMSRRAPAWPGTQGRIIRSELTPDAHDSDRSVHILYRYTVAGQTHESSNISYAVRDADADSDARLLARYPVGQAVQVHYDPQKPARAVLEVPERSRWQIAASIGIALTLFAWMAP